MSLDLYISRVCPTCGHDDGDSFNITHNLGPMAEEASVYGALWRPEENGIEKAGDLVPLLEKALKLMSEDPERFRVHDAPNGWGTLDSFTSFCEDVLEAAKHNPDAKVRAYR